MIKLSNLEFEVPHPGIYIKDAIDELGISQNEFAIRTGITSKTISNLINGECNITFDIASKLALFFNNSVIGWMNLQTSYDEYLSKIERQKLFDDEIKCVQYFDKQFLNDVCGVKLDRKNRENNIIKLRELFMVSSLLSLKNPDMFSFNKTSYKKQTSEKEMVLKNAWISLAYKKSRELTVSSYNKDVLLSKIPLLKSFTKLEPEEFTPLLKKELSEAGIKYIELPYLKGSNISGVTRWLTNESAIMVAINDCGKDADRIWFTLFHELGHAINNHKRHLTISLQKGNVMDEEENQANIFAENSLINRNDYNKFVNSGIFTKSSIIQFANKQNVAPFIVVGRLQKDNLIEHSYFSDLKKQYSANNELH